MFELFYILYLNLFSLCGLFLKFICIVPSMGCLGSVGILIMGRSVLLGRPLKPLFSAQTVRACDCALLVARAL